MFLAFVFFCITASSQIGTGDLVFVHPQFNPNEPVDNAILQTGLATVQWLRQHDVQASNETASHVAFAWRHPKNGSLYFIQAVPPSVVLTAEAEFWHVAMPNTTFYHGVIRNQTLRAVITDAARIARQQVGKPYANDFQPPPASFYCSSLIEFAFDKALRSFGIFGPADFPLIFVPLPFWVNYYAKMGLALPINTTGSNPTLQLHSPQITFQKIPVHRLPSKKIHRHNR